MLIFACPEHADKQPLVYEMNGITGKTAFEEGAYGQKLPSVDVAITNGSNKANLKPRPQELKPHRQNIQAGNHFVLLERPFACMSYLGVLWAFFRRRLLENLGKRLQIP